MENSNSDNLLSTKLAFISNRLLILEDEILNLKQFSKTKKSLNLLEKLNFLDKSSIATSFRVNPTLLLQFRKICVVNNFTLLKGLNISFLIFIHFMGDNNDADNE
jgi:hypothetical protein